MKKRFISLIVACILLPGCVLLEDWQSPNVQLVGIEYLGGKNVFEQRFLVTVNVQNPNNRTLPIEGININLEIEGKDIAEGVNRSTMEIAPLGEDKVDLILTTNLFKGARALIKILRADEPEFEYAVSGSMSTGGILSVQIPFESAGTFKTNELAP